MDERDVFVALERDGVFADVCPALLAEAWEDEGTILDVGRVIEAEDETLSSVVLVFDAEEALAGDVAGDFVACVGSRVFARAGLAVDGTPSLFDEGNCGMPFDVVTLLLDAFEGVSGILLVADSSAVAGSFLAASLSST